MNTLSYSSPVALRPLVEPAEQELLRAAWRQAASPATRQQLLQRLRQLPRPPRALHHLVSAEFLAHASSADLATLIKSEPVVAARVLAAVNAPLYGLGRPVTQLGQAITFLGMQTVRSVCLRHLLESSFPAPAATLRRRMDALWGAGLLASELAFRLAHALQLPNPAGLSTRVLLSFVGHLAALALLPADARADGLGTGLLERHQHEQRQLGLSAPELGHLLLQEWGLPTALVESVDGIDALLFAGQQLEESSPEASARAVGYLSARLGERLTLGQLRPPLRLDAELLTHEDFFCLQGLLPLPALRRLPEAVQAPDLNAALERRLEVMGLGAPRGT